MPILFVKDEDKCGNCFFFLGDPHNVCRRMPATPIMVGIQQGLAGMQPRPVIQGFFAPMSAGGWCGEHQRKEDTANPEGEA